MAVAQTSRAIAKKTSHKLAKATPRARAQTPIARAVADALRAANAAIPGRNALPAALLEKRRERAQQRVLDALVAQGSKTVSNDRVTEIETLARRWAEQGFDEGFHEAAAFELRCFEEGELARARESGNDAGVLAAIEAKHRAATLDEHGKIEIRGLQMSARVYQDLDVAYVPLWVQDDSQKPEVLKGGGGIEIRSIPRLTVPELLGKHERAVLVGAPGSGKTTIVAYLAAQAASGNLHKLVGWSESPVPFVVAVRSIGKSRLDAESIAKVARGIDADFVRQVLKERRGLVLVDGLDEAHEGAATLMPALQAFADAHPGNRILVTTRPAATVGSERVEIPGFVTTTLAPMSREEVHVFIDRWCEAAERSIQKDRAKATEDARRAAEDLKGRVQTSRPVERLAQTPLICSVLCIVHRFLGQRIPERRAALYETCTNVLLYEWDRGKFPEGAAIGQLDAQEKKLLLSGLARSMHEARVAEVACEEVVKQLGERLPWIKRAPGEAESIVREIQDRSGLLVERRPGFFAFSHLTFQEYLTAVEIVRVGELNKLVRRHADRWWHEVTVLAAGLPGADAASLIGGLLNRDPRKKKISTATLLAAQCVATAIELPTSLRKEVEERIALLVPPKTDEDVERIVELGEVAAPLLLRALDTPVPAARARTALALGSIGYEPAHVALVKMLGDTTNVKERIISNISAALQIRWEAPMQVFSFATIALFNMSLLSTFVQAALEQAIPSIPARVLEVLGSAHRMIVRHEDARQLLGPETTAYLERIVGLIKAAHPKKPSAKRAARSG
jgi:hypothetical protein